MHPSSIKSGLSCLAAVLVLTSVLAAQQPSRDAVTKPAIGTSVVAGTVIADEPNGRPLRRVTVTLSPASSGLSIQRMTLTDDAGRFVFTELPAGNYGAPRASKTGYVSATYGEKRPGGIGTPITLTEGQRLTLTLKMLRGAVITGTLFDQDRPAAQTAIRATPIRTVNGERQPGSYSIGGSGTTDDRGAFRIYGLAPGDYIVSASPRFSASGELRPITPEEIRWAQQQLQPAGMVAASALSASGAAAPPRPAQAVAYTPVYYPGTTEAVHAVIVTVAAGQERSGVDFGVQFVPTARISGTIVAPDGQAPQNPQVNLISRTNNAMLDPIFMLDSMMMMRPTVVNGNFALTGVRPGEYTLVVRAAPPRGNGAAPGLPVGSGRGGAPPPMTLWASADITVNGIDQSDIQLRLERGMELSGRIAFDGTSLEPPADLSRVSIRLSTAPSPGGVTVSVNAPSAQVAPDGTFMLEGVTPGRYFLSASTPAIAPAPGGGWTVKSIRVGDADAVDVPFEVRPAQNISEVVVTFTDRMAELSGTLFDAAGHPTSELSIVLFSTDRTMWSQRSRRLRAPVRASTDGKFKFTSLPAGEYYLAALTDFEPAEYYKPEFLEQVAAVAMKVTLADGEKKVQDLKIAGQLPVTGNVLRRF